jgi:uncharacterized protein GlcG (DUF336 family)
MKRILFAVVASALSVAAQAQQPNPLDTVAEKMPFDVPYGTPISLERAQAAIAAAMAEAKKRDWKMGVAVVDSGANVVAFQRMDGTQIGAFRIAVHKARAAAQFRRDTKVFETGVQSGLTYLLTLDGMIGARAGIPLIDGGKLIGAIGCSGGTGAQDEVVCKAGAAILNQ